MTGRDTGSASSTPYRPGMDRRRFLLTSLAGVLAVPLTAGGRSQKGRYTGSVRIYPETPTTPPDQGPFWDRMRELGWGTVRTWSSSGACWHGRSTDPARSPEN